MEITLKNLKSYQFSLNGDTFLKIGKKLPVKSL
jgi:hypothetical protein